MSPLAWTEFIPDFGGLHEFQGLESAGGGRVLRRIYRGPDMPIRLAATTDGLEWSELPLPNGFQLADIGSHADATIDLAGERWVAFGHDVSIDPDWTVAEHVWFSDDQGSSWVKANIEPPPRSQPLPPYGTEESAVLQALAHHDRLVVVVMTSTRLDLDALLNDRGLVPAGKDLMDWKPSRRGFTLTFADELPPEGESVRRGRDRWRLQDVEMSAEGLSLSTTQQQLLQKREHRAIRIYSGQGPSLELSAEYEGWAYKVAGAASPDGVVLATQGAWEALLTSADGRSWHEQPLDSAELWATGGGDGALWTATRTRKGMRIGRVRYRDGQTTVALAEDIKNLSSFAAGRAGVAAAGLTGRSAVQEPGLMKTRVRRAGRTYTHSGHGDYRADELRLGWSLHGDAFRWQPASEAFGVDPSRRVSVALAVGEDFILAEVFDLGTRPIPLEGDTGFEPSPVEGSYPAAVPQRWFIARTP